MRIAAILLVALTGNALAQPAPLGRLFFTPEQRAALERQRQRSQYPALADDGTPLTLNGQVVRSSGHNTTWINGTPLEERDARALASVPLRPGETASGPGRGERSDLLNGGQIIIKRRPAQP